MDSALRKPKSLSVHRSFVVELDAGAEPRAGRIAGRVEHVVSGRAADFSAAAELFDFIASVLETRAGEDEVPVGKGRSTE